MPTPSEQYAKFGGICRLCSHFKPERMTAETEDKIMDIIAKLSLDVADANILDQVALIYGHCRLDGHGVFSGKPCSMTIQGKTQFSLNYDDFNFTEYLE